MKRKRTLGEVSKGKSKRRLKERRKERRSMGSGSVTRGE